MNRTVTLGIVLSRNDFGEADRILTILTPDHGRIRVIAKGVRKIKSKLAGGIELFSISQITFIKGKSEIYTLISTRLKKHYGNIVKDVNRTMFGYTALKLINKTVEDNAGEEYFNLLEQTFEGLDDLELSQSIVEFWLYAQLLKLTGHSPNLQTDIVGNKLEENNKYNFNLEKMAFFTIQQGRYGANHIKLLRLGLNQPSLNKLAQLKNSSGTLPDCLQLAISMSHQYLRI